MFALPLGGRDWGGTKTYFQGFLLYNWIYQVYHYSHTKQEHCPEDHSEIFHTTSSHFCRQLFTCQKEKFLPTTAPSTMHPLGACLSDDTYTFPVSPGTELDVLYQYWERKKATNFSDSDMHYFILACEQPIVKFFINCVHHLSREEVHCRDGQHEFLLTLFNTSIHSQGESF